MPRKPRTIGDESYIPGQPTSSDPKIGARAAILAAMQTAGTAAADIGWLQKGVDFYAYLDVDGSFDSVFTQPADWGNSTISTPLSQPGVMQSGTLQIAEDDIDFWDLTGEFDWNVDQSGVTLASRYADISPSFGYLGSSNMGDMLATPSLFGTGWAISYGFYDSGTGIFGLTNQDQSYIYATRDLSSWMGGLATSLGAAFTTQPFAVLVLPGAHDSGMFDPTAAAQLTQVAAFLALLAPNVGIAVVALEMLSQSALLRTVIDLAMTQKDNITTMLNLGVRYFDFRPGYCYGGLLSGIFHQHNFIPGYPYQSFLEDVLNWLTAHPTEIVVVSANFQGFFDLATMAPTAAELGVVLTAAQQATGTSQTIVPGNKYDLVSSYASLIYTRKRLIFLNQIGASDDTTKYDSYSTAYQTADVNVILQAIGAMTVSGQANANCDYTVLQLQGTASAIGGGIFTSIATMSDASSPLMSTKPGFDNQTYPWVRTNVPKNLSAGQLVVLLNDFADNALASAAIAITTQRLSLLPDLWFIKTTNAASGLVEVHQRTAASGYQTGIDLPTSLSPADAGIGRLQMAGSDLWFIKTVNAASGFVEVHQRTAASGYQTGIELPTSLSPSDANNGWFQMVGSDLWFIKTVNAASGFVEVHQRTAASGYQTGLDAPTSLLPSDADNGPFQVGWPVPQF